jgi:hypothetical protein
MISCVVVLLIQMTFLMQDLDLWEISVRRSLINHSSLECLRRYRRTLLTPLQNRLIRILSSKIDRFPDYFARDGQCYPETAGLALMSDWDRAIDFITCMDESARRELGVMHAKRPVLNCRFWRLCNHCAWRREMDLQGRFLPAYGEGCWGLLTLSFSGFLPMNSGCVKCSPIPITHNDLIVYWDANRFAIEQMVETGMIRGAVMVEELHIESLYPVSVVMPHSHAVVLLDTPFDEADMAMTKTWIAEFCGKVMDVETEADDPRWDRYIIEREFYKMGIRRTKPRKPPIAMEINPLLKAELPVSLKFQSLPTERVTGFTFLSHCEC